MKICLMSHIILPHINIMSCCNMKNLKYIILLMVTVICASCDYDEHIDDNTMIVTSERNYSNSTDKSLFRIEYKSLNANNGLDIYIVSDKDAFEVGDRVKLVKVED